MTMKELESCIEAYGKDIYTFCLHLAGRQELAEDLYQDTFLTAVEVIERIDKEANMKSNNRIRKSAIVVASVCMIVAGSVTAYAAYRYLSPAQVAEVVSNNGALMKAFKSDEAVLINETQSSNGYDITKDNVDKYFILDKETVLTATPDENGWIDFGSCYIKEEGYVMNGGTGYIKDMIEDEKDFKVSSWATSVTDEVTGKADLSDLEIDVIERNNDGSFTTAKYRAKDDLSYILE